MLHLRLTHRLSLADQKLVELLQQGRFSNYLPAHVGVPGLLIRIPGGDGASLKYISSLLHPSIYLSDNNEILPA